jgi:hypothetical protein
MVYFLNISCDSSFFLPTLYTTIISGKYSYRAGLPTCAFRRILRIGRLKKNICFYYMQSDQVKEDEMGRACSTNGGEEECI